MELPVSTVHVHVYSERALGPLPKEAALINQAHLARRMLAGLVGSASFIARRIVTQRAPSVSVAMKRDFATSQAGASVDALVSATWLSTQLPAVKVIDASWYLPAMKRNGREEYDTCRIPGAVRRAFSSTRCAWHAR